VANSVNIIDGFNGLASGTVAISASALGLIAYGQGDTALAGVCLVVASALFGFLMLNFPFGKIFLGDGGAYLLGFLLAWLAVLLVERNVGVSAWAALLACGYPVIEAVFSILRRVQRKSHFGLPDRLHLHSLVKVRFVRKKLWFLSPVLRNSATSIPLWAYTMSMAAMAVAWPDEVQFLILAFLASSMFYWVWYLRLVRFGSR
jgi:UDP-N-acetylmuramyl pentapeptide phosphotransferase/UDP-N-acetylglucosamine-1-phosphate transferase